MNLSGKNVLLIVCGGIAAYKSLELIRLLRKAGANVRPVLTQGGERFVTPLSLSALAEHTVYTDLFSLKDEAEMGHIRLSREADIILVAPTSANFLAKTANGIADDLATTILLAADKRAIFVPAMNHRMWDNPATRRNIDVLRMDGHVFIGPVEGDMACGEYGTGRMAEPADILLQINQIDDGGALSGFHALVTAGPTYEPVDPVRFVGNRSSGKQGYAIAEALLKAGAAVTLVSGPVSLQPPAGAIVKPIETAEEMLDAVRNALPADIAICTAAVADWRPEQASVSKLKKRSNGQPPAMELTENPDILQALATATRRPALVIGFAAETERLEANMAEKLRRKGCDWIIGNLVGDKSNPVFGSDDNAVILLSKHEHEHWPVESKHGIAARLVDKIIAYIKDNNARPGDAQVISS